MLYGHLDRPLSSCTFQHRSHEFLEVYALRRVDPTPDGL
jgi:hypothetical protein